ncbi:hypothetical protein BDW42DRAFT_156988 [Aspergillus taichungensis]|uniref:Uncharacterized protein n=1 Tax=Aspergillus taichungensis TaxID=482145 RepID=A0A2J5HK99_9EURO|nr:hypothetical protein BDW42DRAFT_156988 [Aspergillus taichungensis]
MGKTFGKINACSAGNFGSNSNKIPQWIKANGGQYSQSVDMGVTHLITTVEAYKKDVEAVRVAKQLRTLKIVSYDWLSDSLLSKTRKPRAEKQYLLENIVKKEKKGKSQITKALGKSKKPNGNGAGKAKSSAKASSHSIKPKPAASNSDYQIYMDKESHTTYSATLFRQQLSKNSREKFQLKIYETKKEPHAYTTYAKYTRTGVSRSELLAPLDSTLDIAIFAFREFFKDKTGLDWEERASTSAPPLPKKDDEGNTLPPREGWFHYDERVGLLSSILKRGQEDAFDASKFK